MPTYRIITKAGSKGPFTLRVILKGIETGKIPPGAKLEEVETGRRILAAEVAGQPNQAPSPKAPNPQSAEAPLELAEEFRAPLLAPTPTEMSPSNAPAYANGAPYPHGPQYHQPNWSGPQYGAPPPGPHAPMMVQVQQASGDRTTPMMALVGFISSLFCCWPLGLLFSGLGYRDSKRRGGAGMGLSIAGILISGVMGLLTLLWFVLFVVGVGAVGSSINEMEKRNSQPQIQEPVNSSPEAPNKDLPSPPKSLSEDERRAEAAFQFAERDSLAAGGLTQEALDKLYLAASLGHGRAMSRLAFILRDGTPLTTGGKVPKNETLAAQLFWACVELAYEDAVLALATLSLAEMFESGQGVPKDRDVAVSLYWIAEAQAQEGSLVSLGASSGKYGLGGGDRQPMSLANLADRLQELGAFEGGPERRELVVFSGHSWGIRSAVFSPDGKRVLTASEDKTARLWDAATGKALTKLEGHSKYVNCAVFSPDGKKVVTASDDTTARLWDMATGIELQKFRGHTGGVNRAVFSPDGQQVLTASDDKTARLWDTATGKELRKFEGHVDTVCAAVFSPDGTQVLTASGDCTARLWDAASGKELRKFEGHSKYVSRVVFSPDGKKVLSASDDKTARLWDAATGKELRKYEGHVLAIAWAVFSPDGKQVLTASFDKTARLWDTDTGKELRKFEGHTGTVRTAVFSADGKQVLTSSFDQTARLWDATTGKELSRFKGHASLLQSACFSPDGTQVLTASLDHTARLWSVPKLK